jgi:hypothetical protein
MRQHAASQHLAVRTGAPAVLTLRTMGRVAKEAADTWTFRKWAARLATRAAPRDYRGQLRHLYKGVLERWRYVAEPEEWVHSSPRSSIAHVLGVEYNTLPGTDPTRVDLDRIPATAKGWGDCDDVSTVVAAGVRALGMTPYFRVSRSGRGGHVSVLARTPRGELVSVDPVGHPEHGFGWAQRAPSVEIWDLDGRPVSTLQLGQPAETGARDMYGRHAMTAMYGATDSGPHTTMLGGLEGDEVMFRTSANSPHYCRTVMGDIDGPRVLAVPMRHLRLMKRGLMQEGTPAVDEHGKSYVYHPGHDMWIDTRLARSRLGQLPESMGGFRSFFRRIGRGFRKAFKAVRRVVKRVVKAVRWVTSKIMGSKFVQKIIGGILQMYGIPSRLTQGVLAAAAQFIKQGGIFGFIRMLRKNPRMALALAAKAARAGLQRAGVMSGPEEYGPEFSECSQGGRCVPVQPVLGLVGVYGVDELGALEAAATPTPGRWYRVKKGDTLLGVAGAAYGFRSGPERYKRAKWINEASANAPYVNPRNTDNLFPRGKVELQPDWSCDNELNIRGATGTCYPLLWIPVTVGDEPVEAMPEPGPGPEAPPELEVPTAAEPPPGQPEPPMPPVMTEPPVAPEAEPEPEPAPTMPPAAPRDTAAGERAASCVAAGGRWVVHPEGNFCDLTRSEPMPPSSPLEPIPTALPPPMPPPQVVPQASEAMRCAASGGVWTGTYCAQPGMCREGTTMDASGQCVPTAADVPPEIEPVPTGPGPMPPTAPPMGPAPSGGLSPWVPILLMLLSGGRA